MKGMFESSPTDVLTLVVGIYSDKVKVTGMYVGVCRGLPA